MEELQKLEKMIHRKLGGRFSLKHRNNGKGKLIFDYSDIDELKQVISKLGH
jgi:ParB family chromosome partitioning protein